MKKRALTVSIVVMTLCTACTAVTSKALAYDSYERPNSTAVSYPLKTGLKQADVSVLQNGPFAGVPEYPRSVLDPDLAAYVPDSFAMLGYKAGYVNLFYVARFYRREMSQRGWTMVDSYGIGKTPGTTRRQGSVTFLRNGKVLTVDMTRTRQGRLQYSLFTYNEGSDHQAIFN